MKDGEEGKIRQIALDLQSEMEVNVPNTDEVLDIGYDLTLQEAAYEVRGRGRGGAHSACGLIYEIWKHACKLANAKLIMHDIPISAV